MPPYCNRITSIYTVYFNLPSNRIVIYPLLPLSLKNIKNIHNPQSETQRVNTTWQKNRIWMSLPTAIIEFSVFSPSVYFVQPKTATYFIPPGPITKLVVGASEYPAFINIKTNEAHLSNGEPELRHFILSASSPVILSQLVVSFLCNF